jgi:hypothetical protein
MTKKGCFDPAHGMRHTKEYQTWRAMKDRCDSKTPANWRVYGGRGITVCERWRTSFLNFLADMGQRPGPEYSLDRYPNNDGNYEPGNCRWATQMEQVANSRVSKKITIDGITQTISEWARLNGLRPSVVHRRLYKGWEIEKALKTPIRSKL